MKTTVVLALSLALTLPLTAQPIDAQAFAGSDANTVLIPIAGRAQGARGELFVTDLTITNYRNTPQTIELRWLPQGGTADPTVTHVSIASRSFIALQDVSSTVLGVTGVGAIQITAVDMDRAIDPAGAIDAHARIWTETTCADLTGTVSQSVPAVLPGNWRAASGAYVHGARQSAQYRTNYGIVNLTSTALAFRVIVSSEAGRVEESVTVPAFGTVHRPLPAGAGGALSLFIEPADAMTASTGWRAYATTVDNFSGSGWTMIAIQPRSDVDLTE